MSCERVLLPETVRPEHYTLQITPNFDEFVFSCVLDINVVVQLHPTNEITLHSKDIAISSAAFRDEEGVVSDMVGLATDFQLSTITIQFKSNLAMGRGVLHIEYKGILNNDMVGFYRSRYTALDGTQKWMASTQFEALDCRRAMPCWDEPSIKATFSITMIVPSELEAVSNMPVVSCTHIAGGLKRVVFDKTPVMSTYLLAFAVAEFDSIHATTNNGVSIRVMTPPGMGEQGRFALNVATKSLDFYDEFFKIPYPLPKLDMIVVTEFAAGAMENWGLVTYRESALLIADESTAEVSVKQRVAMVVCHELAHQWFGNLVTMSWWADLWLNEGFAAWMQHFATDYIFPEWKIWNQYSIDTVGMALKLDSLRSSHPIQVPIKHAEEVEEVFDAISYCKGSTVVRMAQAVLGTDKFREGLQLYMQRHKYQNTETSDLWQAWTDASGINMAGLMTSWTQQLGHPYLAVVSETWTDSSVTLQLAQKWFLADGSGDSEVKTWNIPLSVASSSSTETSSSAGALDASMIAKDSVFTRVIPLSGDAPWVKLNAGQSALLRVSHSEEMIQRLLPAIRNKILPPVDRATLVDDQLSLACAGLAPVELVIKTLSAYTDEDDPTVWKALSNTLKTLLQVLESSCGGRDHPIVLSFREFAKKLVLPAFQKVGWDSIADEDETNRIMRGSLFSLIESFGSDDAAVLAESQRRFTLCLEGDASALSSDIKASVYRIVLRSGGSTEYNKVLATFDSATEDAERKWAINTLGATQDKKLQLQTLDWSVSGAVKLQDCYTAMGSVSTAGLEGTLLAWNYLKANYERIKTLVSKSNAWTMLAIIVYCTNKFCTFAHADEVEQFFETHPLPAASRKISQTIEKIRTLAAFTERMKTSLLAAEGFWDQFE